MIVTILIVIRKNSRETSKPAYLRREHTPINILDNCLVLGPYRASIRNSGSQRNEYFTVIIILLICIVSIL